MFLAKRCRGVFFLRAKGITDDVGNFEFNAHGESPHKAWMRALSMPITRCPLR